jgi:hypothetical protein
VTVPGTRRGKLSAAAVAVSLAATALVLTGAGWAAAGPNPPGNNGTVKIDDTPFDDHPDNEPHVGCVFQVDFYGYDEGDLEATVTFESHPPTGPARELLVDTVFIGEDDNSGGGSEAGLDASQTYTLDLTGIPPHPNQGVHVKLTVNAEGSQGADVKHKVFWVSGCVPSPTTTTGDTTTTTTGDTTTTTTGDTTTSGATSTSGATTTSGASSSSHDTTSTTAELGGSSSSTPSGPAGGELPFTGAGTMALLAVGLALVGLGAATLFAKARQGGS